MIRFSYLGAKDHSKAKFDMNKIHFLLFYNKKCYKITLVLHLVCFGLKYNKLKMFTAFQRSVSLVVGKDTVPILNLNSHCL